MFASALKTEAQTNQYFFALAGQYLLKCWYTHDAEEFLFLACVLSQLSQYQIRSANETSTQYCLAYFFTNCSFVNTVGFGNSIFG